MADRLICPVCGESNPADMEFCRNCQSRLQPLTGPLKGESGPIQPGELPTRKVTSELEPLLPQWLRDARQQARDIAAEDQDAAAQQPKEPAGPSAPDLLDGLASQTQDEDDEVPDWLAQITGATSKKKKPASDDQQVKRVELGRDREILPADSAGNVLPPASRADEKKDDLADWFKQAAPASGTGEFRMPKAPAAEPAAPAFPEPPAPERPAEDLNWLNNLGTTSEAQAEAPVESVPQREEAPDWLKKLQAEQAPPAAAAPVGNPLSQADVPDWLKQFEAGTSAPQAVEPAAPAQPPAEQGVPDWLSALPSAPLETQAPEPQPAASPPFVPTELPDWMSALGGEQETPKSAEAALSSQEPVVPAELPDWISALGGEQETSKAAEAAPSSQEPVVPAELPDWLSTLRGEQETPKAPEAAPSPEEPTVPAELPDWISSMGSGHEKPEPAPGQPAASETLPPAEPPDWMSALGAEPAMPQAAEPAPSASEPFVPAELPDWLSSLGTEQAAPQAAESQPASEEPITPAEELPGWLSSLGAADAPAQEPASAATPAELPVVVPPAQERPPAAPALTPGALAGEDVDAVFASMQTPDWLSAVLPVSEAPSESETAPAGTPEEAIAPAELPSWVQAMRPVESVGAPASEAEEQLPAEKRGPLAGLQGVLPTIPGAGEPSSKPKAQSFKLSATEQQLAHAALLERILAAETSPIPMRTGAVLRSQKTLRWLISAVLLLVLGGIVFGGMQSFALPAGVPNETMAAISAVEAIPPEAPVLVVFDYQPATVGEMEAAGGPLLDHALVLNHPRLVLLSTSPTGSALAERFMSTVLARRGYVRDQQYINLGYLPGGLAGVYNFAQNPAATVPLDAQLRSAWQSSLLAPVRSFSDFAAVIILTDSVESGRTWVEQTALARGKSAMVLVASAQAGPMLLPYVDSGQVNGMVSGIYGAVGVEQRNAGSPACIGLYEGVIAGQVDAKGPSCVRRYWDAYSAGLYLALVLITLGALWNLWQGIRERRAQAVG